jgi:hypothetical protein
MSSDDGLKAAKLGGLGHLGYLYVLVPPFLDAVDCI